MPLSCKATVSLNVLGRAAIPGFSKTRLIPSLGSAGAAAAHVELLTHVVDMAHSWSSTPRTGRLLRLWGDPDASSPLFQNLLAREQLRDQPAGDLGVRLEKIACSGLTEAMAVMLLGGDAVSVNQKTLDHAAAILADHPAVLIPARDGGYVLFGMREHAPELFREIPWGCANVADTTRDALRKLGWSWEEIPGHWDVDLPEDWEIFNQKNKLVR